MPGVLKWLSIKLNCTSQIATLLAATSASDVQVVRGIINAKPDLGLYNAQGGVSGGRSALTIAAERGDLEILKILYEGAVNACGVGVARQSLNSGAEKGQTPLMRACIHGSSPQHLACVKYLLDVGSDPFVETEKDETCLHLVAKSGHTECLIELLGFNISLRGQEPVRLADAVLPYDPPIHFIEMRNAAGFTALHLAALKNSASCLQVLLGSGADIAAGIVEVGNTPHLSRGSTALHIAAARGSIECCNILLDFENSHPELDIRRIKNERNLRPTHLARLAGHQRLAVALRPLPRPTPTPAQAARSRQNRRRRRTQGGQADSRNAEAARTPQHHHREPSITPEAVMDMLIARTQLLLALRDVGLELGITELPKEGLASVQNAHAISNPDEPTARGRARNEVLAAVASFTKLWQQGKLEESASGHLLSSMVPADMQVAKLPSSIFGNSESGVDSYAAAALVQASLNAMAHFSQTAKPLDLPPTKLKPTSPLAAAVVVQVALRKLSGKSHQSTHSSTTTAASLISTMTQNQASPSQVPDDRQSDAAQGDSRGPATPVKTPGGRRPRSTPKAFLATSGAESAAESSRRARSTASQADYSGQDAGTEEQGMPLGRPINRVRQACSTESAQSSALSRAMPLSDCESRDSRPESRRSLQDALPTVQSGKVLPAIKTVEYEAKSALPAEDAEGNGLFDTQDSEDPDAMPMWEGYEMGAASDEDGLLSPISVQPTTPSVRQGSGDLGLEPGSSYTRGHPGESLSRGVPARWSRDRPDEPLCGSLESMLDLKQEPGMVRLGSQPVRSPMSQTTLNSEFADRSSVLSPQSHSSTSGLTPAASGPLLSTTALSETESEKEDENADSSEKDDILDEVEGGGKCAICMDQPLHCAISPCLHKICYGCSYQLCSRGLSIPICPFCRGSIVTFLSSRAAEALDRSVLAEE